MMLRLAEGLGLPLGPDDFADYARAMEAARIPLGGPPPDSSEWEGGDELPLPSRPLLGFGVFEFRQGLDSLLGRSGEDNPPVLLLLQLSDRYEDIMPADSDEPPRANDGKGHCPVRRNDEIIDNPHFFSLFVVDGLAKDLLLRTPADRHSP